MSTIQVATFAELEAAISSCSGSSIAANTIVELTSDITVTDRLQIGNVNENVVIRSEAGSVFKLTPGPSHRDSLLVVGNIWCSTSSAIDNLTFKDIEFSGVTQIQGGITLGPVYIGDLPDGSTITFDGVKWKDNTCPETSALSPTGLRIDGGAVTITDCLFDNNNAVGIGGGALLTSGSSSVTVSDTIFSNNGDDPGEGPALGGGAAYIGGDASFTSCSFTNNGARNKGGAIVMDASDAKTATFTDCTFSGNTAPSGGNDIYVKKEGHTISYSPCTAVPDCVADEGSCPCGGSGGSGGDDNSAEDPFEDLGDALEDGLEKAAAIGTGLVVGLAVGGVALVALLIVACWCCCCKKKETTVVVVGQQPAAGEKAVA